MKKRLECNERFGEKKVFPEMADYLDYKTRRRLCTLKVIDSVEVMLLAREQGTIV